MALNIAQCLRKEAAEQPQRPAVVFKTGMQDSGTPAYSQLTFAELDQRSDFLAWGLARLGVQPGMKTLLMIRPCLDFYALVFALFKVGAVPVMIDPGMGWTGFLDCVAQVAPEVFIGLPSAHLLRLVCGRAFAGVKINVSFGSQWCFWGGKRLASLVGKDEAYTIHEPSDHETAAVLFTSGSTGPAKGVTYTHEIFQTQIRILREFYGIQRGETDLACFPLFSLFSIGLGATAVIPDMDFTHPALVDPTHIIEPIQNRKCTYSFGSPALWDNVGRYCAEHQIRLPGLKRIFMSGAPVPRRVHDTLLNHDLDADAETYTPYGATESLPIANFSGHEMLAETADATAKGAGVCVGKPLSLNTLRIIRIIDEAIPQWDDSLVLPDGEIGEICVKGPVVTREYYHRPEATRLAKITEGEEIWHRVGDLGYLDSQGRLWFCGRKAHRVVTEHGLCCSVCCEAIFNAVPGVHRSALVGLGARPHQTPVIIIEPEAEEYARLSSSPELFLERAANNPLTRDIKKVLFRRNFPVDVRHNAKINREELARWASGA